jgi:branched-chain amino acid transport system ATP-binding protein
MSDLVLEGVTKRFGGVTAADEIDLHVAAGEILAIIGPNGAGKSTVLKLIAGVLKPTAGAIRLGDLRLDELAQHRVARAGVALAHQVPQPFASLTVRENVRVAAMGRGRARNVSEAEHVDGVLELCGLASRAGRRAGSLTLLDLKRLELARALATDPQVIMLDEVAAGLVGRELEEVIELVRRIHSTGRTVLLVEHVEGVVRSLVERVVVLEWGRTIAEGTPAEIGADPRVREVYLGAGEHETTMRRTPSSARGTGTPLLELDGVSAGYGDVRALRDVSLTVGEGEIVAILGANGAGKSTLADVAGGSLRPLRGAVRIAGEDVTRLSPHERARRGLAHCPEGRHVFAELSVRENLLLAAPLTVTGAQLRARLGLVHDTFPILAERSAQAAGSLSGGQQQMLAVGRGLMMQPRLIICDEISLGLAPVAIDALYRSLLQINEAGVAVVVVEQSVHRAAAIADRVCVLERGSISYEGSPALLDDEQQLAAAYFGSSSMTAAVHAAAEGGES